MTRSTVSIWGKRILKLLKRKDKKLKELAQKAKQTDLVYQIHQTIEHHSSNVDYRRRRAKTGTHGLVVVFVVEFFTPVFGLIGGRLSLDYSYKVDYQYDINGNIINKSDVGDYSYNAASGVRPHTPNSITGIKTNTSTMIANIRSIIVCIMSIPGNTLALVFRL
jgi:hypothetical protein